MYDRAALPRQSHSSSNAAAGHAAASADVLMSDIGLLKLCRHCGEHWPADGEFFARDARRQDGLEHVCKACRKEQRLVR